MLALQEHFMQRPFSPCDKELDDRPSDREIKCKLPADALYVDYEISRILI